MTIGYSYKIKIFQGTLLKTQTPTPLDTDLETMNWDNVDI